MPIDEMAALLRQAYDKAPRGKITLAVRLFSIIYANDLRRFNLRELIYLSGISQLEPTIKDGMNLSEYVHINASGIELLSNLGVLNTFEHRQAKLQ